MVYNLIINPRRMCEGYGSHSVCVYLSVTTLAAGYFVYKVPSSSLWHFQHLYYVAFGKTAMFKSFGCHLPTTTAFLTP